jgi:hypothetical protein
MRRKLDFAERQHLKRATAFLLRNGRVVAEIHLGVEPSGQHSLVFFDQTVVDAHVVQPKARQGGEVACPSSHRAAR